MFNLEFLLISSEIELILKWTEDCVLTEKATRKFRAAEDGPPSLDEVPVINRPKDLKFSVIDCKFMFQQLLYRQNIKINFTKI